MGRWRFSGHVDVLDGSGARHLCVKTKEDSD